MLNKLNRPTKPEAVMAVICPRNISWLIAEACPKTPIPAVTLRHRIHQISQNCGVFSAS
jgi:hypothetical protein